jgi:hypothetical protein
VRGNKPTDPVAEMMQSTSYSTALNTSPVSVTCSTPLNSEVSNHGRDKSTFFDTTQAGDTVTRDTDADSEPVTKAMGAARISEMSNNAMQTSYPEMHSMVERVYRAMRRGAACGSDGRSSRWSSSPLWHHRVGCQAVKAGTNTAGEEPTSAQISRLRLATFRRGPGSRSECHGIRRARRAPPSPLCRW